VQIAGGRGGETDADVRHWRDGVLK
jgi:hypothetical protein